MSRVRRPLLVLLTTVALVATGCGGIGLTDPHGAVLDAMKRTSEGSFAFDLSFELDDAAQSSLSEDDPQAAAFLRTLRVSGRTDDGGAAFTIHALGLDVAEMVTTTDEEFFVRIDPGVVALFSEGEMTADDLLAGFGDAPAELSEPLGVLLGGGWIGVDGAEARKMQEEFGGAGMSPIDPEEAKAAFERHFGGVEEFVRDDLDIAHLGDGVYGISLHAKDTFGRFAALMNELLGDVMGTAIQEELDADLDDVPETIGGVEVTIVGRLIERVRLDLFEMMRSAGADDVPDGTFHVALTLSEHGTAGAVEAPQEVTMLDLEGLMGGLFGAVAGIDAGAFSEGVDVEVGEELGYGSIDSQQAVSFLSTAQFGHHAQFGTYAEDVRGLFDLDPSLAMFITDMEAGTCIYDDGERFVVAASADGGTWYSDSASGIPTPEQGELGCVPDLVGIG